MIYSNSKVSFCSDVYRGLLVIKFHSVFINQMWPINLIPNKYEWASDLYYEASQIIIYFKFN